MKQFLTFSALAIVALSPLVAAAQRPETPRWGLGLGVIASNSIIRDASGSDDFLAVPWIIYEGEQFYFRGIEGGYKLPLEGSFEAAIALRAAFGASWDPDDSAFLAGMEERNLTMEGGLRSSYSSGKWKVSGAIWQDLLGEHEGQELELDLSYFINVSPQLSIIPSVGADILSDKKADYYFGVRANEATASRPAYEADAAIIPGVSVTALYRINEQWSSTLITAVDFLPSEITDSPIVDEDVEFSVILGIIRWF